MKKHKAIITMALLGFALVACHKDETPAPTSEAQPAAAAPAVGPEQMTQAYGFAAQMPADTASYAGFFKLGKLWQDFKQTRTWTSIKANPLVSQILSGEQYQEAMGQMQANPEAAKWKAILSDALGNEAFMAMAPGSETKLRAWINLGDDINAARFQAILSGKFGPEANENVVPAILPYVKDLDLPPMIFGFKITSQKAALDEQLAQAEKNLPPYVETASFTLDGGHAFKSMAVTVAKAMPAQVQDALKQYIEGNMSDPQKADATFQALLARRLEIAYGYVGDYFIISIGADHAHLKFASKYEDSLLARPEVQKAADYTGKPLLSFSWASQDLMAACRREVQLMRYYEQMKDQVAASLTPAEIDKLETDLKRIDAEGKSIFDRDVTAMVGVEYRDNGVHGEVFGGIKRSAPGEAMKYSQVPTDSTFLWVDSIADTALEEATRVWFEDFVSSAYDTFQRVGMPRMQPQMRSSFAMFQAVAVPKIVTLYQISRDQFMKSLGLETAFAMDLNGQVPDVTTVPPELHAGKMIRLAYLNDLKDRALLAQSWASYFKLANEIAQMIPPVAGMFPNGLPAPLNEVVDGVSLSYYKLPMDTGDLLPIVAVTDKTFVASSSRSYSLEISKAAAQPGADKPITLDVRLNFKPAFDFAGKWLALAVQYPELFFSGNEDQAADFKKSAPNIASLIQSLRAFDGMSVQVYEENGLPRVTTQIGWNEK